MVFVLAAVVGCARGPERREVSGRVTFNKAPLAKGLITFMPLDGQPTRMDCTISDGDYKLEKAVGLADGRYRVLIVATGKTDPIPVPPGWKGPPPFNPADQPPVIPEKYNVSSGLELTVAAGPNVRDFDLDDPAPKAAAPDDGQPGRPSKVTK